MQLKDIKPAMSAKTHVTYCDITYRITGIIMRLQDSEWIYQLELHDLKANSVTIARIEDVEVKGE
jgi:glycyl-tRNA synthetase alpha subunit